MKAPFRNLFSLSSVEQKGVFVLVIIILALTGINICRLYKPPQLMKDVDSSFMQELRLMEQQSSREDSITEKSFTGLPLGNSYPAEKFYFDPNKASAGDLRRLGMPDRLIKTLINYRLHGGKFTLKEDLLRIYGLDQELYRQLSPWVRIREIETLPFEKHPSSGTNLSAPVNINLADTVMLEKLPGIGPVLSRRIVRYRSILGGFSQVGQLAEVYGLSDSLYMVITPHVYADTSYILKLNLNRATEKELARHPYIGKYLARSIITYRSAVREIKSIHELKSNGILSGKEFEKLKIYLTI